MQPFYSMSLLNDINNMIEIQIIDVEKVEKFKDLQNAFKEMHFNEIRYSVSYEYLKSKTKEFLHSNVPIPVQMFDSSIEQSNYYQFPIILMPQKLGSHPLPPQVMENETENYVVVENYSDCSAYAEVDWKEYCYAEWCEYKEKEYEMLEEQNFKVMIIVQKKHRKQEKKHALMYAKKVARKQDKNLAKMQFQLHAKMLKDANLMAPDAEMQTKNWTNTKNKTKKQKHSEKTSDLIASL